MESVVKLWVSSLGLRHQGVLLAAIRGCDVLPKEHPWKILVRAYRGVILNAHCKDASKAVSFMLVLSEDDFEAVSSQAASDFDSLPVHYVLHFMHAAEILGMKHPEPQEARRWAAFYRVMCRKFHINPESEYQLDARLNADEQTFKALQ